MSSNTDWLDEVLAELRLELKMGGRSDVDEYYISEAKAAILQHEQQARIVSKTMNLDLLFSARKVLTDNVANLSASYTHRGETLEQLNEQIDKLDVLIATLTTQASKGEK